MIKYDEFGYNNHPNDLYDDERDESDVDDKQHENETVLKELKRYWEKVLLKLKRYWKKFLFIIRYFTK